VLFQVTFNSQNATHLISGLAAGETYEIRVQTVTTKGDSPYSDVLTVTTNNLKLTDLDKLKQSLGIGIINENIVSKSYKE
jgi:hypothetical protein